LNRNLINYRHFQKDNDCKVIHFNVYKNTEIMNECRAKAESEPFHLKKNWLTAVIFIGIWIALIAILVFYAVKIFYH